MKLYEYGLSRGLRVRWTLQELGVPFESVPINLRSGEHKSAAFLKINPVGKLPALVDGDLTLTESAGICCYLAEKYPEKKLIPTGLRERAEFHRWMFFTVTELEQPRWRITWHTTLYPKDKRLPEDIALARGEFAEAAQVLEAHMRDRPFVVGDSVTVADFVLAYTLDWATAYQALDGFPALNAYVERMYARPHAAPRMAEIIAQSRAKSSSART